MTVPKQGMYARLILSGCPQLPLWSDIQDRIHHFLKTPLKGVNMPNGKPGDHPLTDLFTHRRRGVFPDDMEAMLIAINSANPALLHHIEPDVWAWKRREDPKNGRAKLRRIIIDNGIPVGKGQNYAEGRIEGKL
jgi:hypothetical protein